MEFKAGSYIKTWDFPEWDGSEIIEVRKQGQFPITTRRADGVVGDFAKEEISHVLINEVEDE